jgi:hypothetical protein
MLKILKLLLDDGFWIITAMHGDTLSELNDPIPIFPSWCNEPMDDFPSIEESKYYYTK